MKSTQTRLSRMIAKKWIGFKLLLGLVTVLSSEKLYAEPPEANVLFEIQVAALREWSVANTLRTEHVIEQKNDDGTPGLLAELFSAERIQAGIQLGFLTGEPTRVLCQLKFGNGVDAKKFKACIINGSNEAIEATDGLSVKPIDGLPPLFASSVSEKSISLYSEGMETVAKQNFFTMADSSQWTNSGKASVRIAVNVEAFRNVLSKILVGSVSAREVKDELQSCLDNCDRIYASVTPEGDAMLKLVAVAPSTSSAKKLRTRVDGLLFLLRTKLTAFFEESSTGNEVVDEAVQEIVSDLSANQEERAVEVIVSRSDQTQLIVNRLIEIINASASHTSEMKEPLEVAPE